MVLVSFLYVIGFTCGRPRSLLMELNDTCLWYIAALGSVELYTHAKAMISILMILAIHFDFIHTFNMPRFV